MADTASKRPTVLVTRRLPDAVHARLARDYDARLNPDDALYTKDALIAAAQDVDAIMPCHTEHFTEEVFAKLPERVKIIANFSVGYDHVDVEAAKKHGVIVTNTPEVLSDATAETTILLMLGAARRASEGERLVRSGGSRAARIPSVSKSTITTAPASARTRRKGPSGTTPWTTCCPIAISSRFTAT